MPNSNNRKSREDKSFNNNRFDASSKNDRQDRSNTENKKRFDGDRKKSFGDRPSRSERPSSDERGQERRTGGERPFARKPFQQDSREKGRDFKSGGERSSDRRSFGGDKREGFSGGRPQGDRPFEKKPFERRPSGDDRRSGGAGGRTQSDRPYEKKSFGSDRRSFGDDSKRERRPYSEDRKPFGDDSKRERKPYSEDRKPGRPAGRPASDRPYERKPFRADDRRSGGENRNWTSEEHVGKPNLRQRRKTTAAPSGNPELIRLNRYIANAGICSRRKADELIEAGVITVNGESINELGHKINPMTDVIRYNGETLKREKMTYVLLNKPKDYITTTEDPQERKTVMHLVEKASKERIYPIGRLDRNTTGLLLMTNDGDLAEKLSHPRNNITKIYQVELNKSLSQGDLNKIAFGLELEDGVIKVDEISYVAGASKKEVGVQIHSGKNRIVRRIFEHLGYEVVKLDRVVYANLTKKDLGRGRWRYLEEKEIIQLKHLIK
ncbi:MAG: pseudouridine synthase [Arcticibacter sp.]